MIKLAAEILTGVFFSLMIYASWAEETVQEETYNPEYTQPEPEYVWVTDCPYEDVSYLARPKDEED